MSVKTQRSPTHVPPVIHRYGLQSTTLASVAAGPPPASLLAIKRLLREQTRLQPVRRPSTTAPSSPPARPSTSTPLLRVSARPKGGWWRGYLARCGLLCWRSNRRCCAVQTGGVVLCIGVLCCV